MSICNFQDFLLSLSINPKLVDELFENTKSVQKKYNLTPKEIENFKKITKSMLNYQQLVVVKKRIRTAIPDRFQRAKEIINEDYLNDFLMKYITINTMKQNTWRQTITEFYDLILDETSKNKSLDHRIIQEVIQFEKLMYNISLGNNPARTLAINNVNYEKPKNIEVTKVNVPAEIICSVSSTLEEYKKSYGVISYLLAKYNGEEIELFEIDENIFNVMFQKANKVDNNILADLISNECIKPLSEVATL